MKITIDNSNGITLTLLGVLFIGLKLTGHINWSWWWVTLPFWGGIVLVILLLIIIFSVGIIKAALKE
jgi:hypothetical protein